MDALLIRFLPRVDEIKEVLGLEPAVAAKADPVAGEEPQVRPAAHRIRMRVQKVGHLGNSEHPSIGCSQGMPIPHLGSRLAHHHRATPLPTKGLPITRVLMPFASFPGGLSIAALPPSSQSDDPQCNGCQPLKYLRVIPISWEVLLSIVRLSKLACLSMSVERQR